MTTAVAMVSSSSDFHVLRSFCGPSMSANMGRWNYDAAIHCGIAGDQLGGAIPGQGLAYDSPLVRFDPQAASPAFDLSVSAQSSCRQ